jgi:hypothetical protein
MGMIPMAEIRKRAEDAFPEILKAATEWKPVAKLPPMKPAYPAEKFKFTGNVEDVSKLFFEKGWSLGLPVIPPTPERVAKVLKGTSRKPDEVLGQMPPRMGTVTVELVAVHAVMAGCKPEYMPVLIAALEALLDPTLDWTAATTGTMTVSPLVIVNGPIVKEIGIAYGEGSAGKMHHANASIGCAINLIATIAGGAKPPDVDKSTIGGPSDFVCWIFGENEDALPKGWDPYHVDRGFKRTDSVVTVKNVYPPINNRDHNSVTPEELVRFWSYVIGVNFVGGWDNIKRFNAPAIVALGPEHAKVLADAGWTKDQFRKALWQQPRTPLSAFPESIQKRAALAKEFLGPVTPETLLRITMTPDSLHIVIAGGAGKHSHWFPNYSGEAVSKLVKK